MWGRRSLFQLNREGQPEQPYAAYVKLDNGAKIVVMAEGMASPVPGSSRCGAPDGHTENPEWWGKNSGMFMD